MSATDVRVADGLHAMATSLAGPKPDAHALAAAESETRAALISKVAALPPSVAVSPAALAAFKQQHAEMKAYVEKKAASGAAAPS